MSPANASPGASPAGLKWTVTGQTEVLDADAGGKLVPGYRVSFTTPSGIAGSIFVPKQGYQAQNVRALLAQHIAELEAVSGSTGS